MQITFPRARPELTYVVQGSDDLATNPGVAGQTVTYTDSSFTAPRRFLRLKVLAP